MKKQFMTMGISFILSVFAIVPGHAWEQIDSYEENLTKAKADLEDLYSQWRRNRPQDPNTYDAFNLYLQFNRVRDQDPYSRSPKPSPGNFSRLHEGSTIIHFSRGNSPDLILFRVDLNGGYLPNQLYIDHCLLVLSKDGKASEVKP